MIFSSPLKIVIIRIFQVLMLVFTLSIFTPTYPRILSDIFWIIGLIVMQWFACNTVAARIDAHGLTYRRVNGLRQVPWNMIHSAVLWRNASGVIVRLEGRSILTRYKFLLDSKPGTEILVTKPEIDDPIEIVCLREKIVSSIA